MLTSRVLATVVAAMALVAPVFAQVPLPSGASGTLDAVRARGQLSCGVYGTVPGFSLANSKGEMVGLDADLCRAVAAVALVDATKVKFVPLSGVQRFLALQSGEIDILVRQSSWTTTRELNLGLLFAGVNFYDGAGFVVKTSVGVKAVTDLAGATICVAPGTSTELAVSEYFGQRSVKFTPVLINDLNTIQQAFLSGRCDAYSIDRSALASFRARQSAPEDFVLLPETISKEPLGPVVRKGDDKWFDVVRWTLFAQVAAEELEVSSKTVDAMASSKMPMSAACWGRTGTSASRSGWTTGGRSTPSTRSATTARCTNAISRRLPSRAASTIFGTKVGYSTCRQYADPRTPRSTRRPASLQEDPMSFIIKRLGWV